VQEVMFNKISFLLSCLLCFFLSFAFSLFLFLTLKNRIALDFLNYGSPHMFFILCCLTFSLKWTMSEKIIEKQSKSVFIIYLSTDGIALDFLNYDPPHLIFRESIRLQVQLFWRVVTICTNQIETIDLSSIIN